jgi:hypothetical protein
MHVSIEFKIRTSGGVRSIILLAFLFKYSLLPIYRLPIFFLTKLFYLKNCTLHAEILAIDRYASFV